MDNGDPFDEPGTIEGRVLVSHEEAGFSGTMPKGVHLFYRDGELRLDGEFVDPDKWHHIHFEYPVVGRWARIKAAIKRWVNRG